MKVLLVNGSPKPNGSTFTVLSEIKNELEKCGVDAEIIHIGSKVINGCLGCKACKETGVCVQNDIVNETAKLFCEADGIIVGSPVHYAAASGNITGYLDRLFYSSSKYLAGKPAAAVVVLRRGGATAALDQLNKYFQIANMPIVSSKYWNMVHGNNPEEVKQDIEGMQTMRTLAQNMAWLLKCIKAGDENGVKRPEYEQSVKFNYVR